MGDTALRRFQISLEGPYTSGSGPLGATQQSIYNASGANVGVNGAVGTSGAPPYPATRRLSIEKGVGADYEYVWESPLEARGTYSGRYQTILHQIMAKGKIPAFLYADDLTWLGKMLFSGSPVVKTLPNTPVSLLASATIPTAAGPVTTTGITQPANPQMIGIQITYGTASATAQTITVTGTVNGVSGVTDTLNFNAGSNTIFYNPTNTVVGSGQKQAWSTGAAGDTTALLYTSKYFSTISGISTSATAPATSTMTVTGVNAFQWTFPLDMGSSTLYSATAEYFDGTATWQLPGVVAEKFTLTAGIGKSLKSDISFAAKNKIEQVAYVANTTSPVGLGYSSLGSINTAATTGTQNCLGSLSDNILPAIPTYVTRVYAANLGVDPTVAANVTQIAARITDYKFDLDNKIKLGKAADGTPNPTFVGRDYYGDSLMASMTLLFNNGASNALDPIEVQQFLNQQSRVLRVAFPGAALPCVPSGSSYLSANNSWPYALSSDGTATGNGGLYGVIFDLAGKYTKLSEKEVDGRMAIELEMHSEVDLTAMQTPSQITIVNRVAPQNAF